MGVSHRCHRSVTRHADASFRRALRRNVFDNSTTCSSCRAVTLVAFIGKRRYVPTTLFRGSFLGHIRPMQRRLAISVRQDRAQ